MSSKDNQEQRRRSGRPLMILPILLFGLLGVVFYWGLWNNDDRLPSTLIGRPIPEFALPPIEGRQDGLASANLLDQVSLVNVWAVRAIARARSVTYLLGHERHPLSHRGAQSSV